MAVYAIHSLDGKIIKEIKNTWSECELITKGHRSIFKKFNNTETAQKWFESLDKENNKDNLLNLISTPNSIHKKKKQNYKSITIRVPESACDSFIEKANNMNVSPNKILVSFIYEWINGLEPEAMIDIEDYEEIIVTPDKEQLAFTMKDDNTINNELPWD